MHNPHWHLPWDVLVEQLNPHAEPNDALAFVLPDWTWSVYHTPVYNYYLHDVPLLRHVLMERPENVGFDQYKQQFDSLISGTPPPMGSLHPLTTFCSDGLFQIIADSSKLLALRNRL